MAMSAPSTAAPKNPPPWGPARCPTVKAPMPTKENWASEICPLQPVSTTRVRAMEATTTPA